MPFTKIKNCILPPAATPSCFQKTYTQVSTEVICVKNYFEESGFLILFGSGLFISFVVALGIREGFKTKAVPFASFFGYGSLGGGALGLTVSIIAQKTEPCPLTNDPKVAYNYPRKYSVIGRIEILINEGAPSEDKTSIPFSVSKNLFVAIAVSILLMATISFPKPVGCSFGVLVFSHVIVMIRLTPQKVIINET